MITSDPFFNGHKCTGTNRNFFSTLKDSCTLIYFIKHSYINHFGPFLDSTG